MTVEDIRPAAAMRGQEAAMARDIAWLSARRDRFVTVACPACGADDATSLYDKGCVRHTQCNRCGTQYVNPRPDAELIAEFLRHSENYEHFAREVFPASVEQRREKIFLPRVRRVAEMADRLGLDAAVLVEVGAGYGIFCQQIGKLERFRRVIGIEPSPDWADACRRAGVEVIAEPYEKVSLDTTADIIVSFEVIEHLFWPADFLDWCRNNLRPGGYLYLTCPNIAGFETQLLGAASGTVDHEHINLFTPESLSLLVERQGFEVVETATPGELDFDIVRTAYRSDALSRAETGAFLASLLEAEDDAVGKQFQRFLRDAKLSSNMMLLARRRD